MSLLIADITKKVKAMPAGDRQKLLSLAYGAGGIGGVTCALALYVKYLNGQIAKMSEKNKKELQKFGQGVKKKKRRTTGIGMKFFRDIKRLLRICIPGLMSEQVFFLLAQLGVLYLRTMASIKVAMLDGMIVQAITSRNFGMFVQGIGYWMILALPAVFINAMIRYLQGRIALSFRQQLVKHCHDKYLKSSVYYKVCNLDSRIRDCDQLITTDIHNFAKSLANLYGDISKPFMDVFLYTYQLYSTNGFMGPAALLSFYLSIGNVLRTASPPFGPLAAEQGALEGNYRFCHSRLIQNCEEIAFYRGSGVEQSILARSFSKLKDHMKAVLKLKVPYAVIENFCLKYVASVLVFTINAFPIFFGSNKMEMSAVMGYYMVQRKLCLDLAGAIQRVMESYKEVGEVSGYAGRVSTMLEVFDDCLEGKYKKEISDANKDLLASFKDPQEVINEGEKVKFSNVPVVTPNGDVLVKGLNVEIRPGDHIIITGPNGCGKSSFFRIMGGLWPALAGTLERPRPEKLIWIPQRAYLSLGTLQEQIIYPQSLEDFTSSGRTMEDLETVMEIVNLAYVVDREGGWSARQNWKDRLSGGEKQRVGMARMFYHKPKYAILDECTSQVSIDMEGKMYQHAQDIGITLITVSHRPSLWKYHKYVLQFDGQGGVEKTTLRKGHRMGLEQKKVELAEKLGKVADWKKELKEVETELRKRATVTSP